MLCTGPLNLRKNCSWGTVFNMSDTYNKYIFYLRLSKPFLEAYSISLWWNDYGPLLPGSQTNDIISQNILDASFFQCKMSKKLGLGETSPIKTKIFHGDKDGCDAGGGRGEREALSCFIKHLVISINLFSVLTYQGLFCSIGTEWEAINQLFASPQDPQLKRESFSVMTTNLVINLQKPSRNKSCEFVVNMDEKHS